MAQSVVKQKREQLWNNIKSARIAENEQTALHLSTAFSFSTRAAASHHLSLHASSCVCKAAQRTTSRHAPLQFVKQLCISWRGSAFHQIASASHQKRVLSSTPLCIAACVRTSQH